MMRRLFWILLFLNVLAFGAIRYGEGPPVAAAYGVQREIEPDRITLLGRDEPSRPVGQERAAPVDLMVAESPAVVEPHNNGLLGVDEPSRPVAQEQRAPVDVMLAEPPESMESDSMTRLGTDEPSRPGPQEAIAAVALMPAETPAVEVVVVRTSSAPPEQGPPPAGMPVSSSVCLEWGGFDAADVPRATERLAALDLGERLVLRQSPVRHWVFIPPLKSRADAQRRLAELEALGVRDLYVARTNAISLGLFSSEGAARRRLAELAGRGVSTAVQAPLDAQESAFEIRNVGDEIAARLADWAADFPESGLSLTDCSARLAATASDD